MNCKDILRIVRGNGFKLKIAVEAYTTGGRRVESFSVDEAGLKLYKNGTLTAKEYTILEGTTILVEFDGSDALGVYGFQMSGTFEDEAWRWANWNVFQIVETNEKANIPEGCVVLEDTYLIGVNITLSDGDFTQEQANWDETDPNEPSYIQNKPDLSVYLTKAYEVINANVTLNSSTGKYEFSDSQFSACQSAWSAGKIPVLQLVDRSSQQIKVVARIHMFPYGTGVPDSFRGMQQYSNNKFYYAYVVAIASNSYAQSVTMQEEITDLDTIRANASAGATALQEAYQTITASVTLNVSTGKYEFAASQFSACNTAWSAGKIPVLKLVDESTQVVKVLAWVPMFPYGQGGIEAFYGLQQKGQTSYFFAYVGGFTHVADSYAIVVDVQTEIADLETIRSGAAAGATAVQPAAITNMEVTSNKVTSISAQSTDTQYPSAKCVYDLVGDVETLLAAI